MAEILEKIEIWVAELIADTDMFPVELKITPVNNIKLFMDADSGFSINRSAELNRKLHRLIEESGLFPEGDFSLEVSSPGIGEPLKYPRQYRKNIGRYLELTFQDGSVREGRLLAAEEDAISVEFAPLKKKEDPLTETIPFTDIRQTRVVIKF